MGLFTPAIRSRRQWTFRKSKNDHRDATMPTDHDDSDIFSVEPNKACNTNDIQSDDRAVKASRILMALALIIAASILATSTYHFVRSQERQSFEDTFEDLASEIIDISQENVKKVFGVLNGLSVSVTSFGLYDDSTWPYVTIPNFHSHGDTARYTANALVISFLPLVSEDERLGWEEYSVQHQDWIQEGLEQQALNEAQLETSEETTEIAVVMNISNIDPIPNHIYAFGPKDKTRRIMSESQCETDTRRQLTSKESIPEPIGSGPYAPVWQVSPTPSANNTNIINYNLFDKPVFQKAVDFVAYTRKPTFLDVCNQAKWFGSLSGEGILQTVIVQPVFASFEPNAKIVGHLVAVVPWSTFFDGILPPSALPINIVMENTCNEIFSFSVDGDNVTVMSGEDDLHDTNFDNMVISSSFAEFANSKELLDDGVFEHCVYTINVYPTKDLQGAFESNDPLRYVMKLLGIFLLTSVMFIVYDCTVQKRQIRLLKESAEKHEVIISSLFPANVRDRVYSHSLDLSTHLERSQLGKRPKLNKSQSFYSDNQDNSIFDSKPIADLFAEATVMFSDISGFTAWSSVREPAQVFTLLERVYHSFDMRAKRRGVFKVETIGDSYVAAAGLPEKREGHAVIMTQFARDCLKSFHRVTKRLELVLGPDTSELDMRFGLHSGPVTAGVLRGEKARFQLFGDTVNTASRMESTGLPGRIQMSQETAALVRESGFEIWIKERDDIVMVKGKGAMVTYWFQEPVNDSMEFPNPSLSTGRTPSSTSDDKTETSKECITSASLNDRIRRLVEWNTAILREHLKRVVASRTVLNVKPIPTHNLRQLESQINKTPSIVGEVQDYIELPDYCNELHDGDANWELNELPEDVELQLTSFVSAMASLYRENSFHCFEHANHVTMSACKLLSRIVAPTSFRNGDGNNGKDLKTLHDFTYGITSDPLTQFSIVLAALIHDLDHQGVSNIILMKQDPELADYYKHKSVAEQHSVDIAWNTLMGSEFEALRNCIYCNESELQRFRQLMVNSVMATDIFDKELGALRKKRWDKAFSSDDSTTTTTTTTTEQSSLQQHTKIDLNRKATIVIEHLIQASDVSHTMQHWHIYEKWNSRLFEEMYHSFQIGLTDKDPSEGWYEGEIWFFDNYIIPLAKKLENCGVFGVSSDEYLNYALANRKEWESKGKVIVDIMVQRMQRRSHRHLTLRK